MARVKSKRFTGVYLNHLANGDISYSITYKDASGKVQRLKIGKKSEGITETYAHNKRNEIIAVQRLGEVPEPIKRKHKKKITTLNDLALIYFTDKVATSKANLKQLQKYNIYVGHVDPAKVSDSYKGAKVRTDAINGLGSAPIDKIDKARIRTFRQSLIDMGKAPKTVNGIIQLVTAIFNHAIKEKDMQIVNPCTGVKRIEVDDERERYLSANEVRRLLDAVKDDEQLNLFTRLALSTGARVNTIMHIQKKHVNLNNDTVILQDLKKRKKGSTYSGFIDDDLKALLTDYLPQLTPNSYLIGKGSEPKHPRTVQRKLKRVLDRLFNEGLDRRDTKSRVVVHSLRHTFASNLVKKGVPLYTVQRLLNHADIAQTQRYAKDAEEAGLDAVKGLWR